MNKFFVQGRDIEELGCLTSWDGIMSEGTIGGDVIELDWQDGAVWQRGTYKVYSFEVPLTFYTDTLNPKVSDAWQALQTIRKWRETSVLQVERRYYVGSESTPRREIANAVLVSELSPKVQFGKFVSIVLVFQQLSGSWTLVA